VGDVHVLLFVCYLATRLLMPLAFLKLRSDTESGSKWKANALLREKARREKESYVHSFLKCIYGRGVPILHRHHRHLKNQ
jgi:hypothetical protein